VVIIAVYFVAIMLLTAMLATIIGTLRTLKRSLLRYFPIYTGAGVVQILFSSSAFSTPGKYYLIWLNFTINIFILIEFIVIYLFYFSLIRNRTVKQLMKIIFCCFPLFLISYWIIINPFASDKLSIVAICEALCIIFPSLTYLFQFFTQNPNLKLTDESSFWVTIGILFYFNTTFPFYIFRDYMYEHGYLGELTEIAFNGLCYSMYFVLIIRAFLCEPKKTI
jgi:hypothetical protein